MSATGFHRTLGDLLALHIESARNVQISDNPVSIEEYVDGLFSPNPRGEITADIIMGRLQLA
jgi:hypothetical protein